MNLNFGLSQSRNCSSSDTDIESRYCRRIFGKRKSMFLRIMVRITNVSQ